VIDAAIGSVELPFVPSGQWDRLPEATHEAFAARRWTVSHRSDRMGLRLEGDAIPGGDVGRGFVSDATVTGAIQLSGDGLPIVLGVDRQTTGGYPKLGAVASVALHLLGQLQPGDEVTFRPITLTEARDALRSTDQNRDRRGHGLET
jgi:allophanate hydrolase subunit 2